MHALRQGQPGGLVGLDYEHAAAFKDGCHGNPLPQFRQRPGPGGRVEG